MNRVYCGNSWSGDVSVIDCAADTVMALLAVGDQPVAMSYDSMLDMVYCASRYDGSVAGIDCASNAVVASRWLGGEPAAIACDAGRGRVYCADADGNRVVVLEGESLEVRAVLPVGRGPSSLAWDPGTGRMYVGNYLGSSLTVLRDTSTGIEEVPSYEGRVASGATVVRGVLWLDGLGTQSQFSGQNWAMSRALPIALRDISGRKVMTLKPGENDVRHLPSGVYFLQSTIDNRQSKMTRVVISR
jgi:YVTN family beta-propeller protein